MTIEIYRGLMVKVNLPLESAIYTDVLMGEHSLVFTLSTIQELDIQIGDTCTYKGQLMTINKEPEVTRNYKLDYTIRFEGARHSLARFLIKDEGALTFDYLADLETYMFMFLESINASDSGWDVGELEEVEPFALEFDQVDHLSALNMISEACKCEWSINGKEISIKKTIGIAHNYPLAYGKDNGLYSIKRVGLENSKIITRAYAVGGSQNLPVGYPYKKLTLSGYLDDENAQAVYGIREGVIEDQEIYPKRTSTATAVSQINNKTFVLIDSTIDFDLNSVKINDNWAIVFKSGSLISQQFKIVSYNHATKTIRYEANEDAKGELTPFGATVAEVGDSYTLVGIRMPESYKTNALNELADKRLEYLNSNKAPRVVYDVAIDPLDLKRNAMNINPGDILPFRDEKIGLNDNLRVTSVRYSATFPEFLFNGMTYEIEVGNEVTYNRLQKIEKDIKETKDVVMQTTKQSLENDRRNITALNEFKGKVFDPDGNLENTLLQAIAGVFGSESMYFDLEEISIAVNASNDANRLTLTAGRLIHKSYEIAGLGYIWNLSAFDQDDLEPLKTYYLAAKVSRIALVGEWILSENELAADSEANYWYFNLGILSSVIEGSRSFRPTKMFTLISGGQIETDVITAKLINVQKLFAQIITVGSDGFANAIISGLNDKGDLSQRIASGMTSFEDRYSAPFQVLDNGSMKASKGLIGGFDITSTSLRSIDVNSGGSPTSASSGIILSDLGILSRNSGMSFLAPSTGYDFSASLVGETSSEKPSSPSIFYTNVRAGIIGVRRQELTSHLLNQLLNSYGRYGAMFSSIKILGAKYEAIHVDTSSSNYTANENDYTIIKAGSGAVLLPSVGRETGRTIEIKNAQSGLLTIQGNGKDVYTLANTTLSSFQIPIGSTRIYKYSGTQWIEFGGDRNT